MGGNAIENARRIKRDELVEICFELQEIFPELKMKPIRAYKQKPDFGDIDIVVEIQDGIDIPKLVKERINPPNEFHNNMFHSFEYKGVQVDFISMSQDIFLSALNYFAWNDLGNFIGRTARSLGFKYGHEGLMYELRLGDHYKKSITVSTNTKAVLEFLGYSYDKWFTGFETKDDIFEYAASSKYFNVTYFTLEDQSHNDRVRNKKRKMYQDMLAYITEHGLEGTEPLSPEERQTHYDRARSVFGDDFHDDVTFATDVYNRSARAKKYFNGGLVSIKTGLVNKDLGLVIAALKKSWERRNSFAHPVNKLINFDEFLLIEKDEALETLLYTFTCDEFFPAPASITGESFESLEPFYSFAVYGMSHSLYIIGDKIYRHTLGTSKLSSKDQSFEDISIWAPLDLTAINTSTN